jgi:integrase/recombinase XerD
MFQHKYNIGMFLLLNHTYQALAESFHRHLTLLGHSKHGALIKHDCLLKFLQYLESEGIEKLEEVKSLHITAYYNKIKDTTSNRTYQPIALKTLQQHMRSIELFFVMLQDTGQLTTNPFSALKFTYPKKYTERTVLTLEEIQLLYSVCKNYQESAILSLAYGCGLRVSEMVSCNVEDVKLREHIIIVKHGKGNKRRVIPLSNTVKQDLYNYFYYERPATLALPEVAFMLHSKGGRMKKYTYNKVLKILIIRTGSEAMKQKQTCAERSRSISIHTLRHSIATHLLEQGMNVEQVREFLGHAELETTQIYTHISQKQLNKLV